MVYFLRYSDEEEGEHDDEEGKDDDEEDAALFRELMLPLLLWEREKNPWLVSGFPDL